MLQNYTIRNISREELDIAVNWAASEGWNPGIHDTECFYQTDPAGYFMAFIDDEPAGSVSAVKYGNEFSFIGFFIVKPEYRGRRIGLDLGNRAMTYTGNIPIGIDGVENKVKNYKTYGFKLAWNNARYEGKASGYAAPSAVFPIQAITEKEFFEFDRKFFPGPRETFLKMWISRPGTIGLGIKSGDKLSGYGVIRPCREGWKIGPLFAETPEAADTLFTALQGAIPPGDLFYLDIPVINESAKALVGKYNMKCVFKTARMYKNGVPELPLENIYGITTYELG